MAQAVKYLSCKHEDLSLSPQNLLKLPNTCLWSSAREAEAEGSLGLCSNS